MVRLIVPILLIAIAAICDAYIFHRYIPSRTMWRWIWWLPTITLTLYGLYFAFFGKGMIEEYTVVNVFLLLMALFCIPKLFFTLFSFIPKIGTWLGLGVSCMIMCIILWGITYGFSAIRIRHVEYANAAVPQAFDGYRIVQISDAHVGTFRGAYSHLLRESIDTINSLKPNLICFVGDLANFTPEELIPHANALSSLRAEDGIMSIMGNHDYSTYIQVPSRQRQQMVQTMRAMQRKFGWKLLENENHTIYRRDKDGVMDSIVVIGEENWGKPPFPQYGNLNKALKGLNINSLPFTLMLSHDPTAWKEHILTIVKPNITMSGHTHGTQFSMFGWSPASMVYEQWGGEYYEDPTTCLSVSTGIGGNFPFRFNMPREIVLITLRKTDIN